MCRRRGARRRNRVRAQVRSQGDCGRGDRRPGDRVCRLGQRGPRVLGLRRDRRRGVRFTDDEAKYLEPSSKTVVPADLPRGVGETVRAHAIRVFLVAGGSGPGGLLRGGRRADPDQRDQHHAGIYGDLDVPQVVGCQRHPVPGVDRPADRPRFGPIELGPCGSTPAPLSCPSWHLAGGEIGPDDGAVVT